MDMLAGSRGGGGPLPKTSIRPGTCLNLADCLRAAIAPDRVHLAELRPGIAGAGTGCYLPRLRPGRRDFGPVFSDIDPN